MVKSLTSNVVNFAARVASNLHTYRVPQPNRSVQKDNPRHCVGGGGENSITFGKERRDRYK